MCLALGVRWRHHALVYMHSGPSWSTVEHPSLRSASICHSLHLFISQTCTSQDGLIETCIIHPGVLSAITERSSEQRGAKHKYNQSTRLWHAPQWDLLIGCHRTATWMEKSCRPFHTHRDCLDPVHTCNSCTSLVFYSLVNKTPAHLSEPRFHCSGH